MAISDIPEVIRANYEIKDYRHASSILMGDFPEEWKDIVAVLENFKLYKDYILAPGGRKSPVAEFIDSQLFKSGWIEKSFETAVWIDGRKRETPTHSVDCYKNRVALEIEWNNKDPFFDRDLNNFRLLFDLGAISVGVIITRCDELQDIFGLLGKGKAYGASTTHMSKLIPRIEGGGGGGCPILVFGMKATLYRE